jgi:hypothetical protein
MEKKPPDATPKKADPKVSKDELPEGDLNKVTGTSAHIETAE